MIFVYDLEPLSAEGFWYLLLIAPVIAGFWLGYYLLENKEKYVWGVLSVFLGLGTTLFLTLGGSGLALLTAVTPALVALGPGMYFYNNSKNGFSALVMIAGILLTGLLFLWMLGSGQLDL